MGTTCDLCHADEAAVYCFADKAVMCAACDRKVHSANKLAQKHERVSLTAQPEDSQDQCDICQEEKAIMFCSEDRALICRRCDLMIHTANEFTKTHHRHLLSGISPGLHALPAGCLTEAGALPPRSTRAATAAAHQSGTSVNSSAGPSASPAPSTPPSGQLPGQDMGVQSGMEAGSFHHSQSGALIDVNLIQGNPADALMGRRQFSSFKDPLLRSSAANASAGVAGPSAGPVPQALGSYDMERANSSMGYTLAADLLGMPSLHGEYNAKDIDAVFFGDGIENDLEDWSSFLEGADPSMPTNVAFEQPLVSVRDPKLGQGDQGLGSEAARAGPSSPNSHSSGAPDFVVPEVPTYKKQRI